MYDWQHHKQNGFDLEFCKKSCKLVVVEREHVVVQVNSDVIYAVYGLPGADSKLPAEPLHQLDISATQNLYSTRIFKRALKTANSRIEQSKKLKQEGEYQKMIRSLSTSFKLCKLRVPIISETIRNTPISYTVDSEDERKNETSMYFMMYINALVLIY